MSGRVDEEQTAVNPRVLDVLLPHSGELLPEVSRVLILDVFDDGIPASLVVDLISIARSVDDVETELDAVLGDDCEGTRWVRVGEKGSDLKKGRRSASERKTRRARGEKGGREEERARGG